MKMKEYLTKRDSLIISMLGSIASLIGKRKEFDEMSNKFMNMTPEEVDREIERTRGPKNCPHCGGVLRI